MTCAELTLFLGTSVVAANALPLSAIARARQAITPAGVGRNFRMICLSCGMDLCLKRERSHGRYHTWTASLNSSIEGFHAIRSVVGTSTSAA
jgi:hypothetical protein